MINSLIQVIFNNASSFSALNELSKLFKLDHSYCVLKYFLVISTLIKRMVVLARNINGFIDNVHCK